MEYRRIVRTLLHPQFAVLFFFICFACQEPGKKPVSIYERLRPCTFSSDTTLLCGSYPVFENRETNTGRKIDLNIVVIPAVHRDKANPPLFVIAGGPGSSVSAGYQFYADSSNYYRLDRDIVLVDMRGTGKSNPLHCRQFQETNSLQDNFKEMFPVKDVRDCFDSLSRENDLTQYTTTNMAMDLEEVRAWLGYEKISLLGVSYGGRLSQVYMKMFPQSVTSAVLWSPAPIDYKMPLYHARFAQDAMDKMFADCASDANCSKSFPRLKEEFYELMARMPVVYDDDIKIPWHAFHTKLRWMMYSPMGIRLVPAIVHEAWMGNLEPFVSLFPRGRSFDDGIADGLYLCVTCTEDVPYITDQDADDLCKDTFMGRYRIEQQQQACANWIRGVVPEGFLDPLETDIPILIMTGDWDPVTPPSTAKMIAEGLVKGYVVNIPDMSHSVGGLSNPWCFHKMMIDFLNDPSRKPDTECVALMQPGPYRTRY